MTISEDFSKWAKNLSTKDISDKSKKTLNYLIKDICGIILSARNENYVQSLVKAYKGSGKFISLGHGSDFDISSSAIIAGTAAHGEDFDDTIVEYLASELKIIAVDFPAHRNLPYSENILFFKEDNLTTLIDCFNNAESKKNITLNKEEISLNKRAREILKFVDR